MNKRLRSSFAVTAAILTISSMAACSSSGSSDTPTDGSGSDSGEKLVIPQQTGVPPWAFVSDSDELIGMLPDLSTGVGPSLGVTIENERTTWENSLLGVESGKYAFAPGADVTPERLEKFDFAIAMKDAYGFQVKSGNAEIGDDMMDVCGLSVGLPASSSPIPTLEKASDDCEDAGRDPIEIKTFPDWAGADLAAQSGQVDTSTATLSAMQYQAKQNPGTWTVTGPTYLDLEIGFVVAKDSEWGPKLVDAVNAMIADGSYKAVFEEYGTVGMMIDEATLVTE